MSEKTLLLLKDVALPHPAQELGSRKHLNAVQQSGMTVEPSIFITHQQVIYFCLRIECLYQRTLPHLSGAHKNTLSSCTSTIFCYLSYSATPLDFDDNLKYRLQLYEYSKVQSSVYLVFSSFCYLTFNIQSMTFSLWIPSILEVS